MPKKIKRWNADAEIMAEVERQTKYYLDTAPAEVGPPADAMKMNDNEAVDWWDWQDPAVTPDMLAGLDDQQASVLKHPRRFELLQKVSHDPEEQVKAAERYRRLSDARKAQQAPEMPMMQQPVQPGPLVRVDGPQGPPPPAMFPQQPVQPAMQPGASWMGG